MSVYDLDLETDNSVQINFNYNYVKPEIVINKISKKNILLIFLMAVRFSFLKTIVHQ